jgi:hypothetical protein
MATATSLSPADLQALSTAIPNPNFAFLLASNTYTTAQVMAQVNAAIAAATQAATTKAAAADTRKANLAVQQQTGAFLKEVRQFVALAFSNSSETLTAFNIPVKKPRAPLSAAARAAAEAKAKATRAARGTKGKVQKAAITGNVTGVTITPVVAPAAASVPAPAAPVQVNAPALAQTGTTGGVPHA